MKFTKSMCSVILVVIIFVVGQDAYASGFGIFTQSSSSLGQAAAVVSNSDSPSTIFFNPALMSKLGGTQVEIGTTLLFPGREFKSDATGANYETKKDVFYPSTFYLTHQFNSMISSGLGVFSPFGLGTDWGKTWEGRYIGTNSEMKTFNINPVISFKVTPQMAIATGLNILFLDTTIQSNIDSGFGFDIRQKFKGDGRGLGYNIGFLYDITDDISLGMAYRSQIKVDIDGRVKFDPQIPAYNLVNSSGRSDITLPQQLSAGISYQGFDRWVLEVGVRWEDWSCFDQTKVKLQSGLNIPPQPRRWNDTFTYNIGANYQYNDFMKLRAGYLFGRNPVPDSTFEPTIPDSDTHLFTIGTSMKLSKFTIDLAYAYQLQEDRKKKNSIGDPYTAHGKYSTDVHILALSFKFIM